MKARFVVVSALIALSGCTRSDCVAPKPPEQTPNGYTAARSEMAAAQNAFKAYNNAVLSYAVCVDEEAAKKIAKGGKSLTLEEIKQIDGEAIAKHNAAVDDLQTRVERFNVEVRAYDVLQK